MEVLAEIGRKKFGMSTGICLTIERRNRKNGSRYDSRKSEYCVKNDSRHVTMQFVRRELQIESLKK